MKKAGFLVVLVFVFGVCGWLGFRAAISGLGKVDEVSSGVVPTAPVQKNILIVSVDSLGSANPQLVSAWVLFAVSSEPSPSLVFLPVYHADGRYPQAMHLANSFALMQNSEPADVFQKELLAYLNIARFDAYVSLDAQAVSVFARLFPGSQPTPQPFEVSTQDHMLVLRDICAALEARTSGTDAEMNWGEIVPEHFRTEMSFPDFAADWIIFTRSELIPHCEVLQP